MHFHFVFHKSGDELQRFAYESAKAMVTNLSIQCQKLSSVMSQVHHSFWDGVPGALVV
jgi:hypothetical protein